MQEINADSIDFTEFEALQMIISVLRPLDLEARRRIIQSAATFLRLDFDLTSTRQHAAPGINRSFEGDLGASKTFSEDRQLSPKEFLHEKQPTSGVQRIACLAYYLTHYRSTPHFKTVDLNTLNTEAAQPRFSNAAVAVADATKQGYLVPATKGNKQISAVGEQFVMALPDKDAARQALLLTRPKRKARRVAPKKMSDS